MDRVCSGVSKVCPCRWHYIFAEDSMKILSVFGSAPQVVKRLQVFLEENNFSRVKVDTNTYEITAERKRLFLWKESIHLKVKPSIENIANIELKVNPFHKHPTPDDESKEMSLQTKLYLYF
jgi:hypothetical protein